MALTELSSAMKVLALSIATCNERNGSHDLYCRTGIEGVRDRI